jgi:prepilin-type N-terminal cleavage/methylation domain-containing protein
MTYNTSNQRNAFSLVELIVVVAIIGILASIAIPSFGNIAKPARETVAQRNLDEINTAVESYRQMTGKSLFEGLNNPSGEEIFTRLESLKTERPNIGPLSGANLERKPFLNSSFSFICGDVNEKPNSHRGVWNNTRFVLIRPNEEVTGVQAEGGAINLD